MKFFRPNVRISEVLKNPEAEEVLLKYAPEVAEWDKDSPYMNQSLYRTIKDDHRDVMVEAFEALENIRMD